MLTEHNETDFPRYYRIANRMDYGIVDDLKQIFGWMMEAVRTSETSVDNYFTRQFIPEENSEHRTRRRENLTSHIPPVGRTQSAWSSASK
jgi:hypothetical protein